MQVETFENTNTVVTATKLETIRLDKNLHAFNVNASSRMTANDGTFKTRTINPTIVNTQGFVDNKNLKFLKLGKEYKTHNFIVLPHEIREEIRQISWGRFWQGNRFKEVPSINIWDAVQASDFTLDLLARVDHNTHMLYDYLNNPIPVGIQFDYISGNITDGRYNLKKLVAHLLSRGDCVIASVQNSWSDHVDYGYPATNAKEAITRVPGYNRSRGCYETVNFTWAPSKEDYLKMWEHCVKSNPKYPSTYKHQAVFELDLLGLRAAGAALYTTFYGDE